LYNLLQKLVAEFIGTFCVVFVAAGSVCADEYLHPAAPITPADLLILAAAYGLATATMVMATAHISGAHLNPAITAGFWVTKRMGTAQSLLYGAAQLLGAIAAGYLLVAVIPDSIWGPAALGTPNLASDFTRLHGMLLEGVMTFFVVFIYFASVADAKGAFQKVAGFGVGLAIAMDVLLGAPFTGASMNPARTLGPAVASHQWSNHGVYWVGPLLGGIIAAAIYDRFFLRRQPAESASEPGLPG